MAQPVSIKRSLLVNFLLIIILLSGAITAITFLGNRQTVRTLSSNLLSQAIDYTQGKLETFFSPVIRELLLARSWGMQGVLNTSKPEYLRQLFVPVVKEFHQVSALILADARGREFMLRKDGQEWMNRLIKLDKWTNKARFYHWKNDGKPLSSWKPINKYDPRRRPWYTGAVNELAQYGPMTETSDVRQYLHWTLPYTFYSGKEPGITASIYFKADDGINRVIGFDILLHEISKYTMSLRPSENGKVFVLTDDLRVIGLPRSKKPMSRESINNALLKRPLDQKNSIIGAALNAYLKKTDFDKGPLRFTSQNQVWLAEFRRFNLSQNRKLWIAALVPETDIIGDQTQFRIWIIAITLIVMLIAIVRGYVLAKGYSHPLNFLVKQSERISRGMLYQGDAVDSGIVEIQRLADAHEKMRIALKSLLKLESDLQLARQIQQNTFPTVLPTLDGIDIDAWSQPAEETGGDTYDIIGYARDSDGKVQLTDDNPAYAFLLMADATGHGIGPALSANEVRSMLRMAVRTGEELENIAVHINEQLFQDLHAGRFITAWLCELDVSTFTLKYFSAGQAPMVHFHKASGEFSWLEADSAPFGIMSDLAVDLPVAPQLEPGDIFIVLSDGVYEATNGDGNQFGLDKVLEIIKECADQSCTQILLKIRQELDDFTGDTPANDDRTAILVKRN